MGRWSSGLCLVAGLMGASGVALAALGTHRGGGETVRIGAEFLLIHAVAVLALGAVSETADKPLHWRLGAIVLAAGTTLFGIDLALSGLADLRPFPAAAPIGGMGMIAGWLWTACAATSSILRNK